MAEAFFSAQPNRVIATGTDGTERLGPVNAAEVPRWAKIVKESGATLD